jgi:hypothetical protein
MLRELIARHFDESEIETACFDLQVDYERLPGQGKDRKIVELLEHMARSGRLVELIDLCERQRPGLGWGDIRAAALADPAHFLPDLPRTGLPDEPGGVAARAHPALPMPPERALRIGITVGVAAVLVLLAAFSGGLIAGRYIRITFEPLSGTPAATQGAVDQILTAAAAPSGAAVSVAFTNLEATSLATAALADQSLPLSEPQLRFTDPSMVVVKARLAPAGNREYVAAYTIAVADGRLVLQPETVAMNLLGLPGSTFGWLAVPPGFIQPATDAIQGILDQTARSVRYEGVQTADDLFRTWGVKK